MISNDTINKFNDSLNEEFKDAKNVYDTYFFKNRNTSSYTNIKKIFRENKIDKYLSIEYSKICFKVLKRYLENEYLKDKLKYKDIILSKDFIKNIKNKNIKIEEIIKNNEKIIFDNNNNNKNSENILKSHNSYNNLEIIIIVSWIINGIFWLVYLYYKNTEDNNSYIEGILSFIIFITVILIIITVIFLYNHKNNINKIDLIDNIDLSYDEKLINVNINSDDLINNNILYRDYIIEKMIEYFNNSIEIEEYNKNFILILNKINIIEKYINFNNNNRGRYRENLFSHKDLSNYLPNFMTIITYDNLKYPIGLHTFLHKNMIISKDLDILEYDVRSTYYQEHDKTKHQRYLRNNVNNITQYDGKKEGFLFKIQRNESSFLNNEVINNFNNEINIYNNIYNNIYLPKKYDEYYNNVQLFNDKITYNANYYIGFLIACLIYFFIILIVKIKIVKILIDKILIDKENKSFTLIMYTILFFIYLILYINVDNFYVSMK